MTNSPTYFYWWHLATAANFLQLLFSCLCWFTKNAGLRLSLLECRNNLPTTDMVRRCMLVQVSNRNGNFHHSSLFQSEVFSKSQWEWCKMKCCNPNEMQLKFRKAWFSFLFIQNNEFLSWFTMAFSLLSLFECCLLGVIIHNSVVSTMGPWSLGGLQIPRNNMNLARIMCCVRCSCESSTVWER